ncbi:MAG: lactate racemase domain-containing protein, partial [Actinomycetota bacterium]|nr:lactate racemase domain-containing protein [Actinomycetota bacterium]
MVEPQPMQPVADLPTAVRQALDAPIGPRLRDLPQARPGARAVIVVTDSTRACPDRVLVPPLLDELNAGGVADADITVLIGLGMHRPSTPQEREQKLGPAVLGRVRVVDHDAEDPSALANLGVTGGVLPVPIVLNRLLVEADLLLATGIVEPHQYAGYSGGRKTAAIGAAGAATIAATHGPRFLDHPGTRLGNLVGNPFHEAVTEIARRAGLAFILNVVCDGEQQVVAVRAGAPEPAFDALAALAARLYTVPVPHAYDMAIGGVGWPKDTNLYQASRAASYLFFAPR